MITFMYRWMQIKMFSKEQVEAIHRVEITKRNTGGWLYKNDGFPAASTALFQKFNEGLGMFQNWWGPRTTIDHKTYECKRFEEYAEKMVNDLKDYFFKGKLDIMDAVHQADWMIHGDKEYEIKRSGSESGSDMFKAKAAGGR